MNRGGRPKNMTTQERFWEKVARGPVTECWLWRGGRNSDGYGRFAVTSTRATVRLVLPHRYAWELRWGAIPPGLHVLHACDTPTCVNPEHLMLGTHRANIADAARKGRLRGQAA